MSSGGVNPASGFTTTHNIVGSGEQCRIFRVFLLEWLGHDNSLVWQQAGRSTSNTDAVYTEPYHRDSGGSNDILSTSPPGSAGGCEKIRSFRTMFRFVEMEANNGSGHKVHNAIVGPNQSSRPFLVRMTPTSVTASYQINNRKEFSGKRRRRGCQSALCPTISEIEMRTAELPPDMCIPCDALCVTFCQVLCP
ncbi:hypothetical protein BDZ45DRAFT_746322 [Acephala macrosclerotiorum]|nr:hypothetical protein BDZ45DRAFT_746322 [Acephala macrosclerotiorum]